MALLVTGIYLDDESSDPRPFVVQRLGVRSEEITACERVRSSLDARRRHPRYVSSFCVEVRNQGLEAEILARCPTGVRVFTPRDDARTSGQLARPIHARWPEGRRPIIVGAGPAGLFAALRLVEAGARPLLLERGMPVEERTRHVHKFWGKGILDTESNVLFGEGGAGAFSDGKIYTRRRDGEVGWVLGLLVRYGADPRIMEEAFPHLGTDRLRRILPEMRAHLLSLGAEIRFGNRVDGLLVDGGQCVGVLLADGSHLRHSPTILATGHSARDTYDFMLRAGLSAEARPLAVGVRMEHPQELVDRALHGPQHGGLPPASYRLAWRPSDGGRSAWTFCMCPGGLVVAATHLTEHLALNGMSYSARGSRWANAALVVHVDPSDFIGDDPAAGIRYQAAIERKAYAMGGSAFGAPGQRVDDFLAHRPSTELPRSSYARGVVPVDLRDLFPPAIAVAMEQAIRSFERKIPGFSGSKGLMLAPETRTTAPIRFHRGPDRMSPSIQGVYLAGEGAGWAGGIVSAALDGMRVADAIINAA